jgi:hypothetical protein
MRFIADCSPPPLEVRTWTCTHTPQGARAAKPGSARAWVGGPGRVPRALPWADELQPFGLSHWAGPLAEPLPSLAGPLTGRFGRLDGCVLCRGTQTDRMTAFKCSPTWRTKLPLVLQRFLNAKFLSKSKVSVVRLLDSRASPICLRSRRHSGDSADSVTALHDAHARPGALELPPGLGVRRVVRTAALLGGSSTTGRSPCPTTQRCAGSAVAIVPAVAEYAFPV